MKSTVLLSTKVVSADCGMFGQNVCYEKFPDVADSVKTLPLLGNKLLCRIFFDTFDLIWV